MNYQKIYNQLITRAQGRKIEGYVEKHHILPRCMGGSNDPSNIAILTAREHFVAHMLLWRIHRTGSLSAAAWILSHVGKEKISSKTFSILREDYARNVSRVHTGKLVSVETRKKIGNTSRGRPSAMKGKSFNLSDEEIERRSALRRGKNTGDSNPMRKQENKDKLRLTRMAPEYREKISQSRMGHAPTHHKAVSVNGIRYVSAAEAARNLGITYNSIIRRIRLEKYKEYFYLS
jgi:hypothetical protein